MISLLNALPRKHVYHLYISPLSSIWSLISVSFLFFSIPASFSFSLIFSHSFFLSLSFSLFFSHSLSLSLSFSLSLSLSHYLSHNLSFSLALALKSMYSVKSFCGTCLMKRIECKFEKLDALVNYKFHCFKSLHVYYLVHKHNLLQFMHTQLTCYFEGWKRKGIKVPLNKEADRTFSQSAPRIFDSD